MEHNTHDGAHRYNHQPPLRHYEHGDNISLLSLNTACLPKIASKITSHLTTGLPKEEVRIHAISQFLLEKQYDVVCLQEMFRKDLLEELYTTLGVRKLYQTTSNTTQLAEPIEQLPSYHVNYYGYSSSHHKFGKACGGLVILSKFPIRQAHQIKFDDKGSGTDRAARKGFLCVELDAGGYPVFITNTHLQAGFDKTPLWWPFLVKGKPEKTARMDRTRQLIQLNNHIMRAAQEQSIGSFFICGDFNIKTGSEEYKRMLSTLNDPSEIIGEYADKSEDLRTTKSGRVDYIFSYHNQNRFLREKRPIVISSTGVENVRESKVSDHSGIFMNFSLGDFEQCLSGIACS